MDLLEVRQLCIERGERRLLNELSLSVAEGEIWQIIGPNGVGKSSLLRALAGLARFGVEGKISRRVPHLYIGHTLGIKKALNPVDNLRWHASCTGFWCEEKIMLALQAVKLGGFEKDIVGSLSEGQQRRVTLARLMLSDARLWLLDEPFTALDAEGSRWLESTILKHIDKGGAALFASHQPSRFGTRQQVLDLMRYVH